MAAFPQGLKPDNFETTYAALKGRSSTVALTFVTFSATSKAMPSDEAHFHHGPLAQASACHPEL
jgi:hypothetical protein